MVTSKNFKESAELLGLPSIMEALNESNDYISFSINSYGFASIESVDYDELLQSESQDNGQLFCDKDDFIMLLHELFPNFVG